MTNHTTSRSAPTCAFITLGCKVNQYDTQAIREQLLSAGYREVPPDTPADVHVINTCSVTSMSDSKGRKYIRRVARQSPAGKVVVTGCSVDSDPHLAEKLRGAVEPGRLLLVGNDAKLSIASLLGDEKEAASACNTWSRGISTFEGHTRAFIKIQDGCNNFCAYCIVPYVRGRCRSRPIESIIDEARRLVGAGYREIVLTGIHAGQYGQDCGGSDLADVVERIAAIEGVGRLRLSSIEAMEVTDRLIELGASGVLCPHFHLPLQSGSDAVLARMKRTYTADDFLSATNRIAKKIPLASFTTDVLLAFPGETEDDYLATEAVCREVGFSRTHIFPYSERPGTAAADMPCKCPSHVIADRKQRLTAAARETALAYKRIFIGARAQVLVETERDSSGKLCGYTDRYVK
ncbi:MAG: tRNA (N(6)-L-threonylcarbamoyladenosine(37)-C(2))-methylthiotransferase MtaB, partial [Planctomycetes bacterium]|nr:tRNA (N(6)-L-threonylcarbamoyladenosine(37)-C(2))-methylthiotransferase MtaB [Planctomycetota bacterium]